MFYVNNVFKPLKDFKVIYYPKFNSFCFIFNNYDNVENNIISYKIENENYDYKKMLKIVKDYNDIGKLINNLFIKKINLKDYKIKKKSNKPYLQIPREVDFYIKYKIVREFNKDYKPLYSEIKTKGGIEIVDNMSDKYLKALDEAYENIIKNKDNVEKVKSIYDDVFLDFNFFNEQLNDMYLDNFKGVRSEYRDLTRKITSVIKNVGLPNFINSNQYRDFINYDETRLPNHIVLPIKNVNKEKINFLAITLNDFIYTCYLINILSKISTRGSNKDELLLNITATNRLSICEYTKENIIEIIKEQLRLISVNKCNNVKLDEKQKNEIAIKTNIKRYKVENITFSSLHECVWDFFYNELFLAKGFSLSSDHIFKCIECKKISFKKGHFLKDYQTERNKYHNNKFYLCDECYSKREKELSKRRKSIFNNKSGVQ